MEQLHLSEAPCGTSSKLLCGSVHSSQRNLSRFVCLFVCLFACLFGVIHPTWEFFTHTEMSPYWWRAANFDLCSAIMAIEQWGFFSMPHLLWHRASVYNGHLRGPVTLTPIAERLALGCHYLFLWGLLWLGFEHPTFWLRGKCFNPLHHCDGPVKVQICPISIWSQDNTNWFFIQTQTSMLDCMWEIGFLSMVITVLSLLNR